MEPNMHDIEDYNDNESPKKRRTVKLVVLFLIAFIILYGIVRVALDQYMPQKMTPVMPQKQEVIKED